jgi:HEPN domain-containing protein
MQRNAASGLFTKPSMIKIPKIHSVVTLYALITREHSVSFGFDEEELDMVDLVYIDTRYPGGMGLLPSGFPTDQDAMGIFETAEKVYERISSCLT